MTLFTQRQLIISLFLILSSVLFTSCEPKNDENLVPSYLHIDKITVSTDFQQGTNSSSITDAWVYIDDQLIGSFELPANIPILTEGKQNLVVRAGIKLNGISNTRNAYPFYTAIKREVNFVKDSVINLTAAEVTYEAKTSFPWTENFNLSGMTLDTTSKSTVKLEKTNNLDLMFPEQDNEYSGIVTMTNDTSIFEAVTVEKYDFPGNGSPVFLEMNYKVNQDLVVGVFYLTSGMKVQRPLIDLKKTDEWKKVYINLTVPKYDTPNATDFQIFIGAQKDKNVDEAVLLIDNMKLVHFNTSK
ncbi:MAG: hypothetical protein ACM3ME_08065 [Chloroflexota bacterium]